MVDCSSCSHRAENILNFELVVTSVCLEICDVLHVDTV
jgi:hypothetical protein